MDVLIDGAPATLEDLAHQAMVNYGAYSSFSVERGGVRGLADHLSRLDASAIELFGEPVGEARLRDLIRAAVDGRDAWFRVSLFSPDIRPRAPTWQGRPKVMIGVSEPVPPLATSMNLGLQIYGREVPHIKHVSTFGLIRARRNARADGYDDALFADADGLISEGSSWNIGFLRGDDVVWPRAPMLAGVAQVLVQRGLEGVGMTGRTEPVRIDDLARFDGAFICNSATPACPVSAIGERAFDERPERIERLRSAWLSRPLEPI